MPPTRPNVPPIVVIFGEDEHRKAQQLRALLEDLLPAGVDRGMALAEYDGLRGEEAGGVSLATVMDDLATLPFLADRRVVVVRDADRFITAYREALERYASNPFPCGALVLVARSFPKTTRLHKATAAAGRVIECAALRGRDLLDFVADCARAAGKRLAPGVADRLVERIGPDAGLLAAEVEKLALFAGERGTIGDQDVTELVGLSREERIFAVLDAAALGRLPLALELWRQVLSSDPAAAFKAVGGIAFVLRRWLAAHRLAADGVPVSAIAPKVMMWRRELELETILRRLPALRVQRLLAGLAALDAQAKSGLRSIEAGVERLLLAVAQPAA